MGKLKPYVAKPLQSDEAWKNGELAYRILGKTVMVPSNMLTAREIDQHARAIAPDTRHSDDVTIMLPGLTFAKPAGAVVKTGMHAGVSAAAPAKKTKSPAKKKSAKKKSAR